MANVLEVQQVDQVFRQGFWMKRVQVLHGVSIKVPERSIFGFLGANGAGKTTLIQLIVGLRSPTGGSIRIAGVDSREAKARAQIGYLPERPYFYEHLTGENILRYFGALSGMPSDLIERRIPEVLAIVRMSEARKVELRRYSKGMLQRIGIAQALLHNPPFLVLDEPMSGLDPLGRKEIRELMIQLASEGRTIFFSTHFIPDVESLCDQVALIKKGRILGCGPIGQFLAKGPLQMELTFAGLSLDQAKKICGDFSIRQLPESLRATITGQSETDEVLQKLLVARAQIVSVNPIRPSLESFFDNKVEGKNT